MANKWDPEFARITTADQVAALPPGTILWQAPDHGMPSLRETPEQVCGQFVVAGRTLTSVDYGKAIDDPKPLLVYLSASAAMLATAYHEEKFAEDCIARAARYREIVDRARAKAIAKRAKSPATKKRGGH